jgi:hypothetical protein
MMATDAFRELEAVRQAGGTEAVLQRLAEHLRAQQKYPELFEARKLQVRLRLGLSLWSRAGDDSLDDETGRRLEDGLLAACREVGLLLLDAGRIHEGWMYLRPVGDKPLVAGKLAEIPVSDENRDELISIAFFEGVDVARGFQWILQYYGTCQAITTLESTAPQLAKADLRQAAARLVRHLHTQLLHSLRAEITQREGAAPPGGGIESLIAGRDELFGEQSYHIDTSHLASTVRTARVVTDEETLALAVDLAEYGRRLDASFQFPGEEPFVDFYPSHRLLFRASLGRDTEQALAYFRHKAQRVDAAQDGALAVEVYVELLARLGKYQEAIEAAIEWMPPNATWSGFAPTLLELAQRAGRFDRLRDHCRSRGDLLGFTAAIVLGS